jgi:hypothetical protein
MLVRGDRSVEILRFAQDDTRWGLRPHIKGSLIQERNEARNYHSPCFRSFLILRLMRSRLSMLRC